MIKKLNVLFFIHIFLLYLTQTKPPESYSLIRGVNENIDLNSGNIDLSIPLFDLTEGHFKFSNILNYESRGFVPHLNPNYVGLNWTMLQFGKITRESRRIDFTTSNTKLLSLSGERSGGDDRNLIDIDSKNYFRNDCISAQYRPIGTNRTYKKDIYNNPFEKDYYASITFPNTTGYFSKSYTFEPDRYYFDFMGYKGYFIVDNEGRPVVYCENASIKVDIDNYGCHDIFGNISFSQLVLTDDQGNKYVFGGTVNELDINYSFNRVFLRDVNLYIPNNNIFPIEMNFANKTNYIDSWLLKKITLNNGTIINAHYKDSNLTTLNNFRGFNTRMTIPNNSPYYYEDIGFPDKQTLKNNNLVVSHVRQFSDADSQHTGVISSNSRAYQHTQIDTYTKHAVLDSITTNNISVNYQYIDSNNPLELTNKYLSKITIKQKNKINKEINFSYENLGSSDKRTFLKNISKTGNENISFDYYNTNIFPPYKNSYYATNDLGYWNGLTDLNPSMNQYITYGFPDDLSKYNVGLLKTVTYPTKGSTTYIYENGDYSKVYKYNDLINPQYLTLINENKNVNAPRIYKKVEVDLSSQQPTETMYTYKNDDNTSSGIIDGVFYYIAGNTGIATFTRKNSSANLLTQNSLYYSTVKTNKSGNGFSKYIFTDRITNPDINVSKLTHNPSNPVRCSQFFDRDIFLLSKKHERGKILKEEIFNNSGIKLKEVSYAYNNFLSKFPNIDKPDDCIDCKVSDLNYYVKVINHSPMDQTCDLQTIYTPVIPYLQTSKITKEYFDNKTIQTENKTLYTDKIYYTNTMFWHPYPVQEEFKNILGTSIKKNLYATDLYQYLRGCPGRRGCPGDNDNFIGSQQSTYYNMLGANIFKPIIEITKNTENKYSLKENLYYDLYPYSERKIRTSLIDAPLDFDNYKIVKELALDHVKFEIYDKKLNIIQVKDESDIPITILYGYNQTLPIVQIKGATYGQVMQAFNLDPLNIDSYLLLEIIKKSDLDINDMTEADLLQELINFKKNTDLKDYIITTYTYDPLIGVKSITSPSGISELYKYDSNNRLEKIIDVTGKVLKEFKYNYKQ